MSEEEPPAEAVSMTPREETVLRAPPKRWLPLALLVVIVAVVVVAAGLHFAGTASTPGSSLCPSNAVVTGAGSTFVAPLMDQWVGSYTNNTVNYDAVGSGTGVDDLQALAVQYAASDAPLTPFQVSEFSQTVLTMPEAAGAIAIIYNLPGLNSHLRVNATFLVSAFEGWITNWNDTMLQTLNPGVHLPDQPILPVIRADGSGTTYVFTQWMSFANPTWASQVSYATTVSWPGVSNEVAEKRSSGVSGYVSQTPYTLGYVDLTYALSNGITFAEVQNPSGNFILPSIANTDSAINDSVSAPGFTFPAGAGNWSGVEVLDAKGAGDYPLTTFTYLMFYQEPQKVWIGGQVTEGQIEDTLSFMKWALHEGQGYSTSLYYDPLPTEVVTADEATLASVTWNGAPVPACP